MKRLFLLLLLAASVTYASANGTDMAVPEQAAPSAKALTETKPVTSKWSLISGGASYTSHFLNSQQYVGSIMGIEASHGRFYRKSDCVSWKLTLGHTRNILGTALLNAAQTSHIKTQSYEVDYAVFYNWIIKDRLQLRLGGSFNVFGGLILGDANAVNNAITVDLQTQFYAQAQIRYGWDFKKWGLDLYANLSTPFMGMMAVDNRYEGFVESMIDSDLNVKGFNHIKFSSFHNLQGLNFELGIDFAFRSLSLSLAYEAKNRCWNAYELQSYRKFSLIKLGVSVNLFAQKNRKASNRQF
jgi:hypothetical protein